MERRAWIRFVTDLDATCRPPSGMKDAGWPARVVNVSVGGVGLLSRHRFERGTELALEIINRAGTIRRTLRARVMHVQIVIASGDPRWLTGFAFTQPLTEEEVKELL